METDFIKETKGAKKSNLGWAAACPNLHINLLQLLVLAETESYIEPEIIRHLYGFVTKRCHRPLD